MSTKWLLILTNPGTAVPKSNKPCCLVGRFQPGISNSKTKAKPAPLLCFKAENRCWNILISVERWGQGEKQGGDEVLCESVLEFQPGFGGCLHIRWVGGLRQATEGPQLETWNCWGWKNILQALRTKVNPAAPRLPLNHQNSTGN